MQNKLLFLSLFVVCLYSTSFSQTYDVVWTDAVGVSVNGNSLTKTASNRVWGNAGAASTNVLPAGQDGYVETVVAETTTARMIGFSSSNANASWNTIHYNFYLNYHASSSPRVEIYESGTQRLIHNSFSTGDVVRVERIGSTVYYKKNGTAIYTSTVPSTSALIVDVALYETGATLNNVITSFPPPGGGGNGGGGSLACNNTISSFPYNEGFESSLPWSPQNNPSTSTGWRRHSGTTTSSGTGPSSGAAVGTYYTYLETSSPTTASTDYFLEGPCFDLTGASSASFGFKYHMYSTSVMGTLSLEATTDDVNWTSVWSETGNKGDVWQTASGISLDSYAGQTVKLRFKGTTSSSGYVYRNDMAIDDLSLTTSGGGGDAISPTAPTNLLSSSTTSNSTQLSWTAASDNVAVTGYDIYRNGSYLGSTTSTFYSVTGLSPSTTYSFFVRAKDGAGNVSANSNTRQVTTLAAPDNTAPSAPTNLVSSTTTANSTQLSWTASSDNVGVTGYDIYRNGSYLASTTSTSYSVTGLSASTPYSFYVRAKDAAGNISANSNTRNVTTLAASGSSLWTQNGSAIYYNSGNVGIGITNPTEALTVNGTVLAKEYKATLNYAWPDYVFLPSYPIMPLKEVEAYIEKNGHLPNIPSAEEVGKEGVNLAEMNTKLLEKVEELTLHIIALEKRIQQLEKQ